MDFPVTLSVDLSLHMPISMQMHDQISGSLGVFTPGPAAVDLESLVNMWWPPGALFGKAKFTETVRHRDLCIMQENHDLGPLLLHAQILPWPDDLFACILHTLKSSRKVMFSAGEVQANGKAIGCVAFWPVTPMLTCGNPVSTPLAFSPTNGMNTVRVGLTVWDLVAGWVAIAVEVIRQAVRSAMSKPGQTSSLAGELAGDENSLGKSFVDSVFSGANATAIVRAIGRATGDYHGPARFQVKAGQEWLEETSLEYTWSDDGHQLQASQELANGAVGGEGNIVQSGPQGVTWF